ncbi:MULTISPECIES: hypothetical protein [Actinotignum]|uniref:hypothetical protein n=1 Tax=Actinotignum TaxID=1653174 RepID=UPI00254A5F02|nr:hypothetical protein [Actinotignum schaalii]MDE1536691.1 hypothetical protein [Actinotignum schaalii]MDK7272244.1 hypothetical protein [Actinotignum schaalii]
MSTPNDPYTTASRRPLDDDDILEPIAEDHLADQETAYLPTTQPPAPAPVFSNDDAAPFPPAHPAAEATSEPSSLNDSAPVSAAMKEPEGETAGQPETASQPEGATTETEQAASAQLTPEEAEAAQATSEEPTEATLPAEATPAEPTTPAALAPEGSTPEPAAPRRRSVSESLAAGAFDDGYQAESAAPDREYANLAQAAGVTATVPAASAGSETGATANPATADPYAPAGSAPYATANTDPYASGEATATALYPPAGEFGEPGAEPAASTAAHAVGFDAPVFPAVREESLEDQRTWADIAEVEPIPDAPKGRVWTHIWVAAVTLLLLPLTWYLISDAVARLHLARPIALETAPVNVAALIEMVGGIALLVVIALLAQLSSLGALLWGSILAVAGLAGLVLPGYALRGVHWLDSLIGGFKPITDNIVHHFAYDLAFGGFMLLGAVLVAIGVAAHWARSRGSRRARAFTVREYRLSEDEA